MSKSKPRLLTLPRDRRRGENWGTPLALGVAMLGAPVVLFAVTLDPAAFGICMSYGVLYGTPLILLAGYMMYQRRRHRASLEEYREVARAAGLTYEERVEAARLEPYEGFSLFRLTQPRVRMWPAACHCFRGQFEGREVLAFEYEYHGRPGHRDKVIRRLQTVVILPNAGLPEFDAGPMRHDWDESWPGWAERLGLGPVVAELDTVAYEPTVVRGHDAERLRRLFGRKQVKRLGSLSECCVESVAGHVLFYAPDLELPPGGVPSALGRAVDIVAVLTEADRAAAPPAAAEAGLGEDRVSEGPPTGEPPAGDQAAG